ncbi:alpha/beta hydrolase [Mumia quercus]|uniref:alpha/beta hydrolase n=1 Tax=Mumia quercus TaxID=2976125 RepID=UPI0021D045E1|nr:alpha/beta hydrolase [Mumia quercus]
MASPLPLRTRVFARVERFVNTPIDQTSREEIPARRTKRAKLLGSRLGRFVSGTPHPDAQVSDRLVELAPVTIPGVAPETEPVTLRVRLYQPPTPGPEPLPVVVLFHGGGWVLGDPEQNEWLATHLAVQTPCVVASIAYRLAPEHPYPAGVLDSWAALRWVAENAEELGGDPAALVVVGDSAGGNLAAVVAALAAENGGPSLAGQALIYPAVEMEAVLPSEIEFADAPVLTSRGMRAYVRLYLDGADPYAPTAAPLHGSLAGAQVPALIQVAGHDPLRDNGLVYAEALQGKGGDVTLTDYGDAVHGFLSLPGVSPSASRARDEIVAFVRRVTR